MDQEPAVNGHVMLSSILYLLALMNPASKVFLLCSLDSRPSGRELVQISLRATLTALVILLAVAAGGTALLKFVFQVELYSLKVAGGVILFMVGLSAVQRGRFHENPLKGGCADLCIVPLGAPLIAGPGTITAAISFSSQYGFRVTLLAMASALLVNCVIMLLAFPIGRNLERLHATGPLVRITGLIVAAVAVQLAFNGVGDWLASR